MNVLSDIVIGDAWGIRESSEGFSVLIARTDNGAKVIEDACNAGFLSLEPVAASTIFVGQGLEVRRRSWAGYTKIWRERQGRVPDFGISQSFSEQMIDKRAADDYRQNIEWAMYLMRQQDPSKIIRAAHNKIIRKKRKLIHTPISVLRSLIRKTISLFQAFLALLRRG